jgi:hypothetical protein
VCKGVPPATATAFVLVAALIMASIGLLIHASQGRTPRRDLGPPCIARYVRECPFSDIRRIENPRRVEVCAHTRRISRDAFPAAREPAGQTWPGRTRRRLSVARRGQRWGDASGRQADHASIREVASAHAPLQSRSPGTSLESAGRASARCSNRRRKRSCGDGRLGLPLLVRIRRESRPVETPAYQRSSGASARFACRPLLKFVQCGRAAGDAHALCCVGLGPARNRARSVLGCLFVLVVSRRAPHCAHCHGNRMEESTMRGPGHPLPEPWRNS